MKKVHGFKDQDVALTLIDVARDRQNKPDLDDSPPGLGESDVQLREYWVVPEGTIPAATSATEPGKGTAYLLYLDRDLATPILKRWQDYENNDATVTVFNYRMHDLVEDSTLAPMFRATEDTFGELAILKAEASFLLFSQVAGTAGDNTTECSFTYDITDLNGQSILTAVDPTSGNHLFQRHGVGECKSAQSGQGYHNGTEWIILNCDEKLATGAC